MKLDDRGLVVDGPRPTMPGPPGTTQRVPALLRLLRRALADTEVLVGRHARLSAARLYDASDNAAAAFRSLGVRPGDRAAASLPNYPDIVVAFLAAMKLGAISAGSTARSRRRRGVHAAASRWCLPTPPSRRKSMTIPRHCARPSPNPPRRRVALDPARVRRARRVVGVT